MTVIKHRPLEGELHGRRPGILYLDKTSIGCHAIANNTENPGQGLSVLWVCFVESRPFNLRLHFLQDNHSKPSLAGQFINVQEDFLRESDPH